MNPFPPSNPIMAKIFSWQRSLSKIIFLVKPEVKINCYDMLVKIFRILFALNISFTVEGDCCVHKKFTHFMGFVHQLPFERFLNLFWSAKISCKYWYNCIILFVLKILSYHANIINRKWLSRHPRYISTTH